ncbi:hypothetical protein [Risungbinella massiliensis]|uniref:hypothetical protein n=1 Tax=Risungbinella massiliensis TaxID=1329796 RepID=UPI0005CC359E|nr:hypothetical protein [Risungbinella massiliensis]
MKKLSCLVILLIMGSLLGGCKANNLNEAIRKELPEVQKVIHTEQINGYTVVMFLTKSDKEKFPFSDFNALAVSLFKGNDTDGWVLEKYKGWAHNENKNITVYRERFTIEKSDGHVIAVIPIIFGEINNANISSVEVAGENGGFTNAQIFQSNYGRFYFKIGNFTTVKCLSKEGEVVCQQGNKLKNS